MILVFILTIVIIVFIRFLMGARKVQKNPILWGFLGALAFLIPVLVLFPIALSLPVKMAERQTRELVTPLYLSFIAIISAVGAFVAIMVYRKYLTKVLTAEKTNSFSAPNAVPNVAPTLPFAASAETA